VTELLLEFSPSAYLTDAQLSRLTRIAVVEDGCADRDPDVHKLLMEKVFPRQGTVVSAKEMVQALTAL